MRIIGLLVLVTAACSASDSAVVAQERARTDALAGVSVILPAGWQAGQRNATQMQLLPTDPGQGEAVFIASASAMGATALSDPMVIRSTELEMLQIFPHLVRVGVPRPIRNVLGEGIRLDWEGTPPGGTLMRLSLHLALHQGQVVSVLAAGPQQQVIARGPALQAIFISMAPSRLVATADGSAPAPSSLADGSRLARDWVARLRGKKLTVLSGYNSGGGGGGMTSRADLILLPDGRFTYESSSSVSISVDGMGGSSSGRDAEEGRWRIVGRGGSAVLELVSSAGNRQDTVLSTDGTQTFLDGERAYVTDP